MEGFVSAFRVRCQTIGIASRPIQNMLAAVIPPSSSFTSFKTELNLPEL
jgi:hypothetical protein